MKKCKKPRLLPPTETQNILDSVYYRHFYGIKKKSSLKKSDSFESGTGSYTGSIAKSEASVNGSTSGSIARSDSSFNGSHNGNSISDGNSVVSRNGPNSSSLNQNDILDSTLSSGVLSSSVLRSNRSQSTSPTKQTTPFGASQSAAENSTYFESHFHGSIDLIERSDAGNGMHVGIHEGSIVYRLDSKSELNQNAVSPNFNNNGVNGKSNGFADTATADSDIDRKSKACRIFPRRINCLLQGDLTTTMGNLDDPSHQNTMDPNAMGPMFHNDSCQSSEYNHAGHNNVVHDVHNGAPEYNYALNHASGYHPSSPSRLREDHQVTFPPSMTVSPIRHSPVKRSSPSRKKTTSSAIPKYLADELVPRLVADIHDLDEEFWDQIGLEHIVFREIQSEDMDDCVKMHTEWFPLTYDEKFYQSMEAGEIWSLGAYIGEHLVGVISISLSCKQHSEVMPAVLGCTCEDICDPHNLKLLPKSLRAYTSEPQPYYFQQGIEGSRVYDSSPKDRLAGTHFTRRIPITGHSTVPMVGSSINGAANGGRKSPMIPRLLSGGNAIGAGYSAGGSSSMPDGSMHNGHGAYYTQLNGLPIYVSEKNARTFRPGPLIPLETWEDENFGRNPRRRPSNEYCGAKRTNTDSQNRANIAEPSNTQHGPGNISSGNSAGNTFFGSSVSAGNSTGSTTTPRDPNLGNLEFPIHTTFTDEGGIFVPSGGIAYILTLGVIDEMRKKGLAHALLDEAKRRIKLFKKAGYCKMDVQALALHVVPYNIAASRFYEKIGFSKVQKIENFYNLHGEQHSAYLYALILERSVPISMTMRMKRWFRWFIT